MSYKNLALSDIYGFCLRSNCLWLHQCRGVPPGARFDPIGPPGVPGFEPNRFVRYMGNKISLNGKPFLLIETIRERFTSAFFVLKLKFVCIYISLCRNMTYDN